MTCFTCQYFSGINLFGLVLKMSNRFYTGDGGTGHLEFRLNGGKLELGRSGGSWESRVGGISLTLNQWTHIAATVSSTTGKIYVDGVPDGSITWSTSNFANGNSTSTHIASLIGTSNWFSGSIDDLKVFNSALVDADIPKLRCGTYSATSPTHYYSFDEGSGTTVANTGSAGANIGTLIGSPSFITSTVPTLPSGCSSPVNAPIIDLHFSKQVEIFATEVEK
jgi:hypothetical protein